MEQSLERPYDALPPLQADDDLPEITPVDTPRSSTRPTGCVWLIGGLTGGLICLLIVLAVPLLLTFTSASGFFDGIVQSIVGAIQPPTKASVIASAETIVQSVQPLGELVSISIQMAKPDISIGVQQGVLNACGYAANHVVVGAVDAGIDLTKFTPGDVVLDASADKYIVTLPAPEITGSRIESSRQYDRTTTTCGVDWDSARIIAEGVAMKGFCQDAIEGGILARAQSEASVTLGAFIHALTQKNVEIHFATAPAGPPLPPSCSRDLPPGWVYDSSPGSWTKK